MTSSRSSGFTTAYVTEDFNIKDLLTHRSGMGLGAGDLMLWPDSSTFTKEEIIHNLRYLKQTSSFRTKYDYDNLLYLVAGEVVAEGLRAELGGVRRGCVS
ncbi:MAG: beta-lactamase family protein [Marinilabiliales bacterium]|nr:beta-lactamase family protein [Marinilabiliales bacterium]